MKIHSIIVDRIPCNCGDCPLMKYKHKKPRCMGVDEEINEIQGDPWRMTYRRSDCPLVERREDDNG